MNRPKVVKMASRTGQACAGTGGLINFQRNGDVVFAKTQGGCNREWQDVNSSLSGREAERDDVWLRQAELVVWADAKMGDPLARGIVFQKTE